jgi:anti-sigma B factor antagonist
MTEESEFSEGISRLAPQGEMTIYNASDWKQQLLSLFAQQGEIEVDLSGIAEIDSAGLQLLIMIKKEALAQGRKLRLTNFSHPVSEALELCGFDKDLEGPQFGLPQSDKARKHA